MQQRRNDVELERHMSDRSAAEFTRTHTFILAGGTGRRLRPLTESRPKPAVSFGGDFRIIDFTLANCLRSRLTPVSVLTQYKPEPLHRHIAGRWVNLWNTTPADRQPLKCVAPDHKQPYRGTADAIFKNLALVDAQTDLILVLAGDHVYHMDYRDLLRQHVLSDADLTIAATRHPRHTASDFGVIKVDSKFEIIGFEEKPAKPVPLPSEPSLALVSMGLYVFKKSVLVDVLDATCGSGLGFDFGRDIIPLLIRSVRVHAYDFRPWDDPRSHYWRDIGTIDSYYAANMDLLKSQRPFNPGVIEPPIPESQAIEPRVAATAFVRNTILSTDVQVEQDAFLLDCVVMPGAHIGKGAKLRRTIVGEQVHIPDGYRVGWNREYDRQRHTVSENGVVVLTSQPGLKSAPIHVEDLGLRSPSSITRHAG